MKKILILSLILTLLISVNVYGEDTMLTVAEDSNGFDFGTNGKATCKSQAYYYCFYNRNNGFYYIFTSDSPLSCYKGMNLTTQEGTANLYRLKSNTYELVNTYGRYVTCTTNSLSSFQFFYSNYTITYLDGNYDEQTFFHQTPLTTSKTLKTIKGGITTMMITERTLMGIKTILVYLIVLVVSALALRKAWVMLRTILSGA